MKAKVLVAPSWPTLCDPIDCTPPGFSVHRILQAGILEWVGTSFSRDLLDPGIESECIAGRFFTVWATRESHWFVKQCFGLLGPTLSLPYLFCVLCTQLLWGPTLFHPWGYFIDHFSSKNLVFDGFFLTLFCSEANVCSFICNQVVLSAKLYLFFFNWCFILNLGNVIQPKGMLQLNWLAHSRKSWQFMVNSEVGRSSPLV